MKAFSSVKGLLFDYGGTLDTDGVHWFEIFRRIYAQYLPTIGHEALREAYIYGERYLATHPVIEVDDDFHAMLCKKITLQLDYLHHGSPEATGRQLAEACDTLVREQMQQTRAVLDALSVYPMALVSNFYGNIHAVLQSYGLASYFPHVIESAVVGVRKPDPAIYALGIQALGLSPAEVLVIGDSYDKDMVPAHSLGCRTVWLKNIGWCGATEPEDTSAATAVIQHIADLPPLLTD